MHYWLKSYLEYNFFFLQDFCFSLVYRFFSKIGHICNKDCTWYQVPGLSSITKQKRKSDYLKKNMSKNEVGFFTVYPNSLAHRKMSLAWAYLFFSSFKKLLWWEIYFILTATDNENLSLGSRQLRFFPLTSLFNSLPDD